MYPFQTKDLELNFSLKFYKTAERDNRLAIKRRGLTAFSTNNYVQNEIHQYSDFHKA